MYGIVTNYRNETVHVDLNDYLQVPDEYVKGWERSTLADLYCFTGLCIKTSGTPPVWLYQFLNYSLNIGGQHELT